MKNTSNTSLFTSLLSGRTAVVLLTASLLITGCQQKQDQPQQQNQPQTEQQAPKDSLTAPADTQAAAETPADAQKARTADLKGTWRGQFDKRATTLKITEMNGNEFKGSITINYREVINQQVSGTIDPETKKVTMKDLLHSRFAGRYSGRLSDDMKSLSGTFTMTLDGSKFQFNLAKK